MNEERWMLVALHELDGIGWKSIDRVLKHGAISYQMFNYSYDDWENVGLTRDRAESVVRQLSKERMEKRKEQLAIRGIEAITIWDDEYPDLLKEIHQPPWVLYCLGQRDLLKTLCVAMVGTRIPTAYGRKVGSVLADELCQAGITIVSGMAKGIDSVCHEASLACGGNTIAVMGTGMDVIYPVENRSLFEKITKSGLVVTEYPLGTPSHPGLFPQRNRIIAGLCVGTLVVEADVRSGSLITADAAMEAGRDVYAVPGPITSPKSKGALELIKQGAKMVTCGRDIMEEYQSRLLEISKEKTKGGSKVGGKMQNSLFEDLTTDEVELYHILEQGPFSLDQLLLLSHWDFGHLHSVLLSLIIKKQITQLAGAIYKII
ncbi:DNA-processing protein DprA [Paenibacillus antarcticus]|uniref:DNA processing protein DprA n=1 Tax=Paenibacillus antarcticus TaxID=253703 RepID=A0A168MWE3_9BACL|nr:DNA-processing protein DprA [Paenibacillus antarcticus]OAB45126.1 DNA processing protein DprA [Paenibacillus antarcticus]